MTTATIRYTAQLQHAGRVQDRLHDADSPLDAAQQASKALDRNCTVEHEAHRSGYELFKVKVPGERVPALVRVYVP